MRPPVMTLENKALGLRRIGWLYSIFHNLYFHHGPLRRNPLPSQSPEPKD